jgi:hypothetical protein
MERLEAPIRTEQTLEDLARPVAVDRILVQLLPPAPAITAAQSAAARGIDGPLNVHFHDDGVQGHGQTPDD